LQQQRALIAALIVAGLAQIEARLALVRQPQTGGAK
jgi:hypothetical protein